MSTTRPRTGERSIDSKSGPDSHPRPPAITSRSDVSGRSRVYQAIVKGENLPAPGIPESFNVLVKELQSLGLSVTLGKDEVV